ncbi:MAG: adenosylmethionine--8-amino-7-oxononanoate transaminase [Verrucomicrobiota bacterium]
MNDETRRAIERDQRHLWHPFTPIDGWLDPDFEPVMIASGDGATLTDTEGRTYLDGNSSIWTNLHGHKHPAINAAVEAQLGRIAHSSSLGLGNPAAAELAEKLAGLMPPEEGPFRVFLSDDGSTAIECALKIAWQYFQQNGQEQRTEFVTLSGGYHGDTIGAMSLGKSGSFHAPFQPLMFPTHEAPAPDCVRGPGWRENPPRTPAHRSDHAGAVAEQALARLEALFESLDTRAAALVLEPKVMGPGGMMMQPEGYLRAAAAIARRHGALVILDEVMTGFGRTGRMLAQQHEGVTADLTALAKGLTGGYLPLGATLIRERLFDGFRGGLERTFFHGHSYCGNQLGCAAALANLHLFETEPVRERVAALADNLREASQVFWNLEHTADVRQEGAILAVELVADAQTREPFPAKRRLAYQICERARHEGLLTRGLGATLFLLPPFCTTPEQVRQMVQVLEKAARETLSGLA